MITKLTQDEFLSVCFAYAMRNETHKVNEFTIGGLRALYNHVSTLDDEERERLEAHEPSPEPINIEELLRDWNQTARQTMLRELGCGSVSETEHLTVVIELENGDYLWLE